MELHVIHCGKTVDFREVTKGELFFWPTESRSCNDVYMKIELIKATEGESNRFINAINMVSANAVEFHIEEQVTSIPKKQIRFSITY